MEPRGSGTAALFREIHKNTWLKRLTADNRKITVGNKKSDRSWVVFCVHDDSDALLEGYIEPRQAGTHVPEWIVSLQSALHISHSLVATEQEFEFVITLPSDIIRFHAPTWEIMQEWVDTLRLKLREMKILSPKENLYSRLPEIRAPLLPTRDPMSPLPAPPPVPIDHVPGIERIITPTTTNQAIVSTTTTCTPSQSPIVSVESIVTNVTITSSISTCPTMSNTLTQNLINMLSDPVTTYSSQVANNITTESPNDSLIDDESMFMFAIDDNDTIVTTTLVQSQPTLAQTFTSNVLSDPYLCPTTSATGLMNQENGIDSICGSSSGRKLIQSDDVHSEIDVECSSIDSAVEPEPIVIPRPQTTRSASRESKRSSLQSTVQIPAVHRVSTSASSSSDQTTNSSDSDEIGSTNITIIQVSSPLADTKSSCFNYASTTPTVEDQNFKSNVQIIPSNSTIHPSIMSTISTPSNHIHSAKAVANVYTKTTPNKSVTVQVTPPSTISQASVVNIGLSDIRNFGPVTQIPIGNDTSIVHQTASSQHYEQVFVTPSSSIVTTTTSSTAQNGTETIGPSSTNVISTPKRTVIVSSGDRNKKKSTSQTDIHVNRIQLQRSIEPHRSTIQTNNETVRSIPSTSTGQTKKAITISKSIQTSGNRPSSPLPAIRQFLQRGLTELTISSNRSSRRDNFNQSNRNGSSGSGQQTSPQQVKTQSSSNVRTNVQRSESHEQRRRSSSTSDAQANRTNIEASRMQQPSQPYRPPLESVAQVPPIQPLGRMTLREQQVIQLRREMMHPGGVRLQLRRKDCIGSIALIDAFGAVWIAGWKQKDHPMLYNALHIGDQLITVAGINVNSSADANKIIRNTQNLYIELIVRRLPFGRAYVIRREMDGQCLGLIRDGNTATIVDVVPNSLSARHGLTPKAKSCDGLSLTFWVLTEINGRPLNLYYKDMEVRDRLNAVGRDISILVQPFDLVVKLKKQLKSLRSYKDYIVQ